MGRSGGARQVPYGEQMVTKLTAYLDESGATGRNFQDRSQPYFIVAGWLCDPADDGVTQAVAVARGHMVELKGARLLRNERGERRAATLLRELLRGGALPLVTITEKRFAVAAKLVEYFLEPTMNDALGDDFDFWDRYDVKKSFANLLYELPRGLTEHLWASLQADSSNHRSAPY